MAVTLEHKREGYRRRRAKWVDLNRDEFNRQRRLAYQAKRQAVSERRRRERAIDPTKERAQANERYARDRERIRARENKRRALSPECREKARMAAAEWRANNPEKAQVSARRYRKMHGRETFLKCQVVRQQRKRAATVDVVRRSVVFERDKGMCGICVTPVDPASPWEVDHVIPISKGGAHSYANVQLSHRSCNRSKAARMPKETAA